MPRFSTAELREIYTEVLEFSEKIEELEKMASESVGETRSAYAIVHKDFLWKLQRKIGQLWWNVCNADDMNPFEDSTTSKTE